MHGHHDPSLVALSILVAIAASYTGLSMVERVTHSDGRAKLTWLAGGSLSMGIGIWSMHFIGMLAFSLPIPVTYDLSITAASLLVAVMVSGLALHVAHAPALGARRMSGAAALMALGIVLIHYIGMAAIPIVPAIRYEPLLLAASVAIAFVASLAALYLMFSLRQRSACSGFIGLAAATAMGCGISGMHFTGMAAAHFSGDSLLGIGDSGSIDQFWLAITITVGTMSLLAITVWGSAFQAHLASRTEKLDASLQTANEKLVHLSTHDWLTGLPNRRLLGNRIGKALVDAERDGGTFALILIDLDRFKIVNDSVGHALGDALLRAVSRRIQGCLRDADTLARLEGDEFLVLLNEVDRPETAADAVRLITDALRPAFRLESQVLHVTATLGISVYPDDGITTQTLLKNADAAMYHAKQNGRNTFRFFTPAMDTFASDRLEVENGLRRALQEDEFVLHYQPKVDIDSGKVVALEALIRWNDPDRGLVQPSAFIPIAEESGLIGPIGEWVLRTACAQAKAWQLAGLMPMRIAVNLSANQFRQTHLHDFVREVLRETGLQATYLELELTESTVMSQPEESVRILKSLSGMGVSIAIDDFGTGYSSLAYLKRLPLDVLKIDRSFITDLASSHDDASIVRAVISMAHSLRLKVIAEGVETREQVELLRALGCDQFQGYYYSRAVDAVDARRFMATSAERLLAHA